MAIPRRRFLGLALTTGIALACEPWDEAAAGKILEAPAGSSAAEPKWKLTWDAAIETLAGNIRRLPAYRRPVLIEGAEYGGIWQECAPMEGLVYADLARYVPAAEGTPSPAEIARANHMAFFALQREDGQLPAAIKTNAVGYGQIQMVVPIAATAWELARRTGDEELLTMTYTACSRWDAWLRRYRDTRHTGLVEGFCTYDTGMDNSPRWAAMPRACPEGDARRCPRVESLPRLCPDLSATAYGGRVALGAMAEALGKKREADEWRDLAEKIRRLIIDKLYCPEDAAFYDLDAHGKFVRVRSVAIARVLGEHVLKLEIPSDRRIFHEVWARQLGNAKAFWPRFPIPSIAMNDPTFVRPIPRNSWGGASQALTALRAPRWMSHYGKHRELDHLMRQWVVAINRSGNPAGGFWQQMDPATGEFTRSGKGGYSPAALVYLDFARRLGLVGPRTQRS